MRLKFCFICALAIRLSFSKAAVVPSPSPPDTQSHPDSGLVQTLKLTKNVLASKQFQLYLNSHPNLQKDGLFNSTFSRVVATESKLREHKGNNNYELSLLADGQKNLVNYEFETVKGWLSKGNRFFDWLDNWWKAVEETKRTKRSATAVREERVPLDVLFNSLNTNGEMDKFYRGVPNMGVIAQKVNENENLYLIKLVENVLAQDESTIRDGLKSLNDMLIWFSNWASKKDLENKRV